MSTQQSAGTASVPTRSSQTIGALLASAALVFSFPLAADAVTESTWNPGAVGDWGNGANWDTDPIVPDNGVDTFDVIINDGETTLDASFTIDNLTFSGGALVGDGGLSVNNQFTWSGGALGGVGATATITVDGPSLWDGVDKGFAAVTLNLNGATTWVAGSIGSVEPPEGGIVNNAGALDLQDDLSWFWNSTQSPVFNNLSGASFSKSGGAGLARIDPAFNNTGDVVVDSGELWLAGGGTSTGTYTVASGTTLSMSDYNQNFGGAGAPTTTLDAGSVVDSAGTVWFANLFGDANTDVFGQFDSAATTIDPGATGEVRFNAGSTFGFNAPGSISVLTGALVLQNEDISFATDLTVDGGEVRVLQNSTLDLTGSAALAAGTTLALDGTLQFSGGSAHVLDGEGDIVMDQGGIGVDFGGGALTIGPDMEIRGQGAISAFAGAVNQGTITADVPSESIVVTSVDNEGLMQATGGAFLSFNTATNSGTIQSAGAGGRITLSTVTNTGTIQATAGSRIDATNLVNEDVLGVSGGGNLFTISLQNESTGVVTIDGGTFTLQSLWDNDGVINANNATVELGGVFSFANVGTINRTGATTVRLIGTLQNAAQVVALDATTGSWTLAPNGVIEGGTVTATGGAQLLVTGGQLDGVILSTSPVFANAASLLIQNGLQLTGADLDLSAGGTVAASLSFLGPAQSITGNGIVTLGNGSNVNHFSGGTVTFGPGIAIEAKNGTISGGASGIVIDGVLNADGQGLTTNLVSLNDVTNTGDFNAFDGVTLRLGGAWHNAGGNIDVINSTLLLAGPATTADIGAIQRSGVAIVRLASTLNNASATLDLADAFDGDLQLRAGTIQGGSIVPGAPAARLVVTGGVVGTGTLDGVTLLAADVVFDPATNGDTLFVRNSLTMNNSTIDMSGFGRTITFNGTNAQLLGGTGEVLLNTASANDIRNNSSNNAVVTFGPNINIHGGGLSLIVNGKSSPTAGGFVNQGNIAVETAGSQMSISHLENQGMISVVPGSTLLVGDGFVQSSGKLVVGGTLTRTTAGPLVVTGGSLGGSGVINADVVAGTMSTTATIGGDDMAGSLTTNGNMTINADSTLAVDLLGTIAGTCYDQYNVSGTVTLTDSLLDVNLGFAPITLNQQFTIISNAGSDAVVGAFSSLPGGTMFPVSFMSHEYQFQISYTGGSNSNDVVLTVVSIPSSIVPGDVNFSGLVDIFDVNLVSEHWGEMGPTGDANGDCIVDIFDVNLISAHWGETAGGGSGATAVPEPPAALSIVVAAAIALMARRKSA